MTKTPYNAPKIVFVAICVLAAVYGALASLAYGFSANGVTVAVNSPTVEIDANSVGDVVTVIGDRNTVHTAVSPTPENVHNQGSWLIALIVLLALGLAVVGVWHLLISGALVTAVDTILLWRKS